MSDDEAFMMWIFLGIAAIGAFRWYRHLLRMHSLVSPLRARVLVGLVPILCGVFLWRVLDRLADDEVRTHFGYHILFLGAWGASIAVVNAFGWLLGITAQKDGLERGNTAARWAMVGAWIGVTLCAAGSNAGEGPTIYTTLGPQALGLIVLLSLWAAYSATSGNADSVSIERDTASGLRLAGLLVAQGLILGRALAGDWTSGDGLLRDLVQLGWPVLPLTGLALAMDLALRPSRRVPTPGWLLNGAIPAVILLIFAGSWLLHVGAWDALRWSQIWDQLR